ncbi:MAG: hypothetical protein OEY37_01305 [Gammaproteobacteria bacterium]|nr:hypothetical protein [Gammaproteobacteria bacterium]
MKATLQKLLLLAPLLLLDGCGQGEVSFADDIQPIVENSCISCHSGKGEGAMASDYLMTDYNSIMKGTVHGTVVVPGSRMSSSLYLVVAGKTAPEIRMPPHNDESFAQGRGVMLSAETIELIGLWIDQGAKNN